MRVLIVSSMFPRPSQPNNGIFVLEQAKALQRMGVEVSVVAPVPWAPRVLWINSKWRDYGGTPAIRTLDGLRVYHPRYLRFPGKWFGPVEGLSMYAGMQQTIEGIVNSSQKPDIFHGHRLGIEGWVAVRLGRKFGIPAVVTGHGGDVYETPFQSRLMMRFVRDVIDAKTPLVAVGEEISRIMHKMGAQHVEIVHNGYDSRLCVNQHLRNTDGTALCFLGRIDRDKGVFDLLEAFRRLSGSCQSVYLTYVGDGPVLDELKRRVLDTGVQNVRFYGEVEHQRVFEILSAQDIFILPSYKEGFPTALIEAMATGIAVVATNVGGIPEVVRHGETGWLVPPGNPDLLAKALEELIVHSELRLSLGKAASLRVSCNYSWDSTARKLAQFYEDIIA